MIVVSQEIAPLRNHQYFSRPLKSPSAVQIQRSSNFWNRISRPPTSVSSRNHFHLPYDMRIWLTKHSTQQTFEVTCQFPKVRRESFSCWRFLLPRPRPRPLPLWHLGLFKPRSASAASRISWSSASSSAGVEPSSPGVSGPFSVGFLPFDFPLGFRALISSTGASPGSSSLRAALIFFCAWVSQLTIKRRLSLKLSPNRHSTISHPTSSNYDDGLDVKFSIAYKSNHLFTHAYVKWIARMWNVPISLIDHIKYTFIISHPAERLDVKYII